MRAVEIALGVALGLGIGHYLQLGLAGGFGIFKRDATDTATERSGLHVVTDLGTGIQYVGGPLGGITVRVDENGKPMKAKDRDQ